jgi:hypothetical protein
MAPRVTAICVLALVALAGCGGGSKSSSGGNECSQFGSAPAIRATKTPWPAPENAMALACKAGLVPEKAEFLQYHVHAHLDVFVNGKPVLVPAGIGINLDDAAVQTQTSPNGLVVGAGLTQECSQPCISPLHTHDLSGLLHTETKTPQPNHLGQFFTEWAVRLAPDCVGGYCKPKVPIKIYVDGNVETGDPRQIELSNLREIAVVIGTPPARIPSKF